MNSPFVCNGPTIMPHQGRGGELSVALCGHAVEANAGSDAAQAGVRAPYRKASPLHQGAFILAVLLPWHLAVGSEHQITTYTGDAVVLRFDDPDNTIQRSPGRRHSWGHAGCMMCLHNHLVSRHGQGAEYLRENGWGSWTTIHDNLHNDPRFKGRGGTRRYIGSNVGPKEPSAFAPTPLDIVEAMLEAANVGPEDVVCDLGCGDGRILVMAALKYRATAVGLDIDPECVAESNENLRLHGVGHIARAYVGDVRDIDISGASVVTLYLMPSLSEKLRPRLQALPAGTRVVAHDKPIPGWTPKDEASVVSTADDKRHQIYLWRTDGRRQQAKTKPRCKT